MEAQSREIQLLLETEGWTLIQTERPESRSYWWVWEFWYFEKAQQKIVLTYLIDPQCESNPKKISSEVWSVSASLKEPEDRLDTNWIAHLSLGKNWQKELDRFISSICSVE